MTLWYPEKGKDQKIHTSTESFVAYSAEKYLSPTLKERIVQITLLLDEIYWCFLCKNHRNLSFSAVRKMHPF